MKKINTENQNHIEDEMPWEFEARDAILRAIENCEKDEIRGHIYLWSNIDHHNFDLIQEEFSDYNSIYFRLTEIGETEWVGNVPWDKGPVFEPNVDSYVYEALEKIDAENFFFGKDSEDEDTLFDSSKLLTPKGAEIFRLDVEEISEELIRYLAKNPKKIYDLSPRKFEELIAELFKDMGYEVELTPASKDGGFDIRAVRKTEVGLGLYFIECKRYSSKNKVGVNIVRNLYGVIESEKATSGLVVTTSFFTKGAFDFREKNKYRIDLADQNKLKEYLQNYKKI